MTDYRVPDDRALERLICEAFECAPGPLMSRLEAIETRLLRTRTGIRPRPRRRMRAWWFALLLAGGTAAAAWWAGEAFFSGEHVPPETSAPAASAARPAPIPAPRESERAPDSTGEQKAVVIDRRESG